MYQNRMVFGVAALTAALASYSASGAVLFQDSFEAETLSTAPSQWTSSTNVYVVNSKASDGSKSLFMRDGSRSTTMATAASLGGAESIKLSFDVAQGSNAIESPEGISVAIKFDTDSGYTTFLKDEGIVDGFTGTYSGTTIELAQANGNSGAFVSYAVTIAPAAVPSLASSFQLRFSFSTGSTNEDYFLDNIVVSTVPEPSSLLLVLSGAVLAFGRRRS